MKNTQFRYIYSLFLVAFVLFSLFASNIVQLHAQPQSHVVVPGDTLWKLSQAYAIDLDDLIAANKELSDPNNIWPGLRITVPVQQDLMDFEQQVLDLTNKERRNYGLNALLPAQDAQRGARLKSDDMRDANYFAHQSPRYGSPFDMMTQLGVQHRGAAENIAAGQPTPIHVVNAWMNSEGHRRNILSSQYTHLGVGYAEGGSYVHYWTQWFITK